MSETRGPRQRRGPIGVFMDYFRADPAMLGAFVAVVAPFLMAMGSLGLPMIAGTVRNVAGFRVGAPSAPVACHLLNPGNSGSMLDRVPDKRDDQLMNGN